MLSLATQDGQSEPADEESENQKVLPECILSRWTDDVANLARGINLSIVSARAKHLSMANQDGVPADETEFDYSSEEDGESDYEDFEEEKSEFDYMERHRPLEIPYGDAVTDEPKDDFSFTSEEDLR
jgi:hypothetical protein